MFQGNKFPNVHFKTAPYSSESQNVLLQKIKNTH